MQPALHLLDPLVACCNLFMLSCALLLSFPPLVLRQMYKHSLTILPFIVKLDLVYVVYNLDSSVLLCPDEMKQHILLSFTNITPPLRPLALSEESRGKEAPLPNPTSCWSFLSNQSGRKMRRVRRKEHLLRK